MIGDESVAVTPASEIYPPIKNINIKKGIISGLSVLVEMERK